MNIPLNEDFLQERDIRFEALQQLREIQAGLVGVSFLPVLGIMRPDNEYRKNIIEFQDDLDNLTLKVQDFISKVKNDVNYNDEDTEEEEEEEPKEDEDTEDTEGEEEPKEDEDTEDTEDTEDKKPEDSSEPKE